MENLNTNEGSETLVPSFSTRQHARRYGTGSKNIQREVKRFEGNLPDNERWIEGLEGRYSISDDGKPYRYRADGSKKELKTTTRSNHKVVRIFQEFEPITYKLAEEIARAFLGSARFIFKDGDTHNVALENLLIIEAPQEPDEHWIDGYEGLYSMDKDLNVYSYKSNVRVPLKQDLRQRVNLYSNGILEKYHVGSTLQCIYGPEKCNTVNSDNYLINYCPN